MNELIQKLIEFGQLAPSGDNTQPWKFVVDRDILFLYIIRNKDNYILNFDHSGTFIAAGAVIENIKIAATHFGYDTFVDIANDLNDDRDLAAKISFVKRNAPESKLFNYIQKRHTNRKPYLNKTIPLNIVEDIKTAGLGIDGCSVKIVNEEIKIRKLANLFSTTERVALETPDIHKLFFDSLVWTREEEQKRGFGLYVKTLELPPPILFLFRKIIHSWNITRFLNIFGFSIIAAKKNSQTYAKSSAMCVVVVDKLSKENYIKAGQTMQRIWLTISKNGLHAQPVTGILFFGMKLLSGDRTHLLNKHIELLKSNYSEIKSLFGVSEGVPVMNLRIGYSDDPTAFSGRVKSSVVWK